MGLYTLIDIYQHLTSFLTKMNTILQDMILHASIFMRQFENIKSGDNIVQNTTIRMMTGNSSNV